MKSCGLGLNNLMCRYSEYRWIEMPNPTMACQRACAKAAQQVRGGGSAAPQLPWGAPCVSVTSAWVSDCQPQPDWPSVMTSTPAPGVALCVAVLSCFVSLSAQQGKLIDLLFKTIQTSSSQSSKTRPFFILFLKSWQMKIYIYLARKRVSPGSHAWFKLTAYRTPKVLRRFCVAQKV